MAARDMGYPQIKQITRIFKSKSGGKPPFLTALVWN